MCNLYENKKQRKNQVSNMSRYTVKIMNKVSLLCTTVGAGLLSAILYGPIPFHDYKNIEICAYGLLIAAFFLGLLALVLPLFKKDCQSAEAVTVERDVNSKTVKDNRKLSLKAKALQGDKVQPSSRKVKRKQVLCADASSLAKNKDSSSTNLQSDNVPLETSFPKNNNCAPSQNSEITRIPITERQLVPVRHPGSHAFNNSSAMVRYPVPQRWNFISNDVSGNFPVMEEVTKRRVSYLANDVTQEEIYVKRTHIYPRESKMPPCILPYNSEGYFKKPEECQKKPVSDVIRSLESLNFSQ